MTTDTSNVQIRSGEGGRKSLPLKGYAALAGTFNLGAALSLRAAWRHDRLLKGISFSDMLILGVGSQQLGRIVSKSRVTTGFRKPFTRYQGTEGALFGEDKESARKDGGELREAIGELLVCPYCSSAWTTATLFGTYLANRRLGRTLGALLTTITVANIASNIYRSILKE